MRSLGTTLVTLGVVALVIGAGCLITWMRRRTRLYAVPPQTPLPYLDRSPEDDLKIIHEYFGTWNRRIYGPHWRPEATAFYRRCANGGWDVFATWRDGKVVAYRTLPTATEPTNPDFVLWLWAGSYIHETALRLNELPPYVHANPIELPAQYHMPDMPSITYRPGKDS